MTAIWTIGYRLRSTPTNGHRFTALGLPWWSPIQVLTHWAGLGRHTPCDGYCVNNNQYREALLYRLWSHATEFLRAVNDVMPYGTTCVTLIGCNNMRLSSSNESQCVLLITHYVRLNRRTAMSSGSSLGLVSGWTTSTSEEQFRCPSTWFRRRNPAATSIAGCGRSAAATGHVIIRTTTNWWTASRQRNRRSSGSVSDDITMPCQCHASRLSIDRRRGILIFLI